MAHEKLARRLIDQRGRKSTRRQAGFSCATLYFTNVRVFILVTKRAELVIVWNTASAISGLY